MERGTSGPLMGTTSSKKSLFLRLWFVSSAKYEALDDLRITKSENGVVSLPLNSTQMSSPSVVQIQVPAGPILLQTLTGLITLQLLVNFVARAARTITWIPRAVLLGDLLQQL